MAINKHKELTRTIHTGQVSHSKRRGHIAPEYGLNELREWIYSQNNYSELFNNWKDSGYKKGLKPSVDRIKNNDHYHFGNIRLVTWEENDKQAKEDRRNGTLVCGNEHKEVIQLNLKGEHVDEFISIRQASRETGTNASSISGVCLGIRNTANGFKWKHKKTA